MFVCPSVQLDVRRVPHITQKRDNDAVRPRAPIMSGFTSHSVMDGTPPPELDFMRSNQSAILGPHVRDLFPLKSCTLKTKKVKKKCVQRVRSCRIVWIYIGYVGVAIAVTT